MAQRLPGSQWPQGRRLLVTAIDADSGDPAVFGNDDGVELMDAVAASTSNGFGVGPYPIHGRRYLDGGYRRNENADLALGVGHVLVLSPLGGRTRHPLEWGIQLAAQVEELETAGSQVRTILPNAESLEGMGTNLMDLRARRPAALAGAQQGRELAPILAEFWG